MKEIREIVNEYEKVKGAGQPAALATVYDVKGSSYRRTGARMLIKEDGNWFGGISGGCIEGNALKRARMVMADGQARQVTYDTSNEDEANIGVSLGCNGVISVIISPLSIEAQYNPMAKLREVKDTREAVILTTVLTSSDETIPAGSVLNMEDVKTLAKSNPDLQNLKALTQEILQNKKSKVVELPSYNLFIEYLQPDIHLVIMGGNYDIYPLLNLATNLGWRKTIVVNPQRLYPPAHQAADTVVSEFDAVDIDAQTVGVVMSHDYNADLKNLASALASEIQYIGVLGPAVRKTDMLRELREKGVNIDEKRIYGPAGLDLGAMQPEEIALSIIAEIFAVLKQKSAQPLRERKLPIHERESVSSEEII